MSAPEFRSRLSNADKWMSRYIANYPDNEGSNWLVFYKTFQCEVHELGAGELSEITTTLKKLKLMDWESLLAGCDLDCVGLAGEPEKYTLRLSASHLAVVGRDGRRMLLLVLIDANQ